MMMKSKGLKNTPRDSDEKLSSPRQHGVGVAVETVAKTTGRYELKIVSINSSCNTRGRDTHS